MPEQEIHAIDQRPPFPSRPSSLGVFGWMIRGTIIGATSGAIVWLMLAIIKGMAQDSLQDVVFWLAGPGIAILYGVVFGAVGGVVLGAVAWGLHWETRKKVTRVMLGVVLGAALGGWEGFWSGVTFTVWAGPGFTQFAGQPPKPVNPVKEWAKSIIYDSLGGGVILFVIWGPILGAIGGGIYGVIIGSERSLGNIAGGKK